VDEEERGQREEPGGKRRRSVLHMENKKESLHKDT